MMGYLWWLLSLTVSVTVAKSAIPNNGFAEYESMMRLGGLSAFRMDDSGLTGGDNGSWEVDELGNKSVKRGRARLVRHNDDNNLSLTIPPPTTTYSDDNDNWLSLQNIKHRKTGTTIVGLVVPSCRTVVLAADTRATEDTVVADKLCEKIHPLARNVYAAGAGTSGDIDALVRRVKYTFLLRNSIDCHSIGNQRCFHPSSSSLPNHPAASLSNASIPSICRHILDQLHSSRGNLGVNLILGGYDHDSQTPILAAIHPHGSIDVLPCAALGSGGLAATSVLESHYSPDLTLEQGIELAKRAVLSGIKNDLGSGSQIDLCILSEQNVTYVRGVVAEETLELSPGDQEAEERLRKRYPQSLAREDDSRVVVAGVNGFGSLPYAVTRRRILMEGEDVVREERRNWIHYLLEL